MKQKENKQESDSCISGIIFGWLWIWTPNLQQTRHVWLDNDAVQMQYYQKLYVMNSFLQH